MTLSDRLNCPECGARLASSSDEEMVCDGCSRRFAIFDGIVDLARAGEARPYGGITGHHGWLETELASRIKAAAGGLWPSSLGDAIEIGCGTGSATRGILISETIRSLLVLDSDPAMLRACRTRVAECAADLPIWFVAPDGDLATIRDAVVDTVIGPIVLTGIGDTRVFLTRVHRMLRIKGRAMFVVPNRRYHQAVSLAIAETLAQRFERDGAWAESCGPILGLLGMLRKRLLYQGESGFPAAPATSRLFASDALAELGREVGFGSAEVLPLDPDPAGGQTIIRMCQDAGASDAFAKEFGPLAATVGRPYFSLLDPRDASAFSLVWLTKAAGPAVSVFANCPSGPPMVYVGADTVVGGLMPRWSVELFARNSPDGVVVTVGGWCLANVEVPWVRVTLDSVARQTPVWRPRPDVHEVLNRARAFHALHALCSGIGDELLFPNVHPREDGCTLLIEIMLEGGLVVTGPAPDRLIMDQPVVISH